MNMRNHLLFTSPAGTLCVLGLALASCATNRPSATRALSSANLDPYVGTWTLTGTHSARGDYAGELEIRKNDDGSYSVTRVIDYRNFTFQNLRVQEVWTGSAHATKSDLFLNFRIRKADFILRYGNEKRSDEDFRNTPVVTETFHPEAGEFRTEFRDTEQQTYQEAMVARKPNGAPLWNDERTILHAEGAMTAASELARPIAAAYFKSHVDFDDDPFVKKYENRPEYRAGEHFFFFDPTDYDFYQKNRRTLRVVNKRIDPISLLETVARQRAYGYSLEEKALGFDRNYVEKHMNPQGLISMAELDPNGNLARYLADGDGALWTGVYAAAQAMKFRTLQERNPEEAALALENLKKSVRGLFLLMDIAGNPREFARVALPSYSAQAIGGIWARGEGPYANVDYIVGGNNDMVKGLFTGMIWAALTVPKSDAEFWRELREHALRLPQLAVIEEKSFNRPIALGIAAVVTGDPALKKAYEESYILRGENLLEKSRNLWKHLKDPAYWDFKLNLNAQWPGYLEPSGIHLASVGIVDQILIAEALHNAKLANELRANLMDDWVTFYGLQRHLLAITAYAFASREAPSETSWSGVTGLEQKWNASMEKALWGLREFPYPRLTFDVEIDYSKRPDWCLSPYPRHPEAAGKHRPVEYFFQGIYEYPLFERQAWGTNYLWKDSAYLYKSLAFGSVEYSGADFLYAYWMARWSGFIREHD